jgi:hypothetical protein
VRLGPAVRPSSSAVSAPAPSCTAVAAAVAAPAAAALATTTCSTASITVAHLPTAQPSVAPARASGATIAS